MRLLSFLFLFILVPGASAQVNHDSLTAKLEEDLSTEERVEVLMGLADHYVYSAPNQSIELSQEALSLAQSVKNVPLIAMSLNRLGTAYWSKGDLKESVTYLNQSLELSITTNDTKMSARNMGYLGNVNSMAGNHVASIEYYQKALIQFRLVNNQNRIWAMLNNIGKSYLGNNKLDSASKYLYLADNAFKEEFDRMRPIHLFNLGELAFKSRNLTLADSLIQQCLEKAESYGDDRAISRSYQTQAEILMLRNKHVEALALAKMAFTTAQKTAVKELIQICSKTLAAAYAKNGNHSKAYEYLKISGNYLDSLQSKLIKNQLSLFKQQQDDLELTMLKQQGELSESKAAARKNIIFGLVGVLLLSVGLMYILIRRRRELKEKGMQLSELNNFKTRMFAIVAHDLRSPVGQLSNMIDVITAQLASPEDLLKVMPTLKEEVSHILGLMDNIFQWAKSNMEGQSVSKDSVDLHKLVEEMIEKTHHLYAQKSVTILNQITPGARVNSDNHLLTIILRNLLVNAVKFSYENSKITVFSEHNESLVKLSVKDEGIGMTPEHVNRLFTYDAMHAVGTKGEAGSGLGLILCKDFVRKLGGTIWVDSEPQKGTTFTFSIQT